MLFTQNLEHIPVFLALLMVVAYEYATYFKTSKLMKASLEIAASLLSMIACMIYLYLFIGLERPIYFLAMLFFSLAFLFCLFSGIRSIFRPNS